MSALPGNPHLQRPWKRAVWWMLFLGPLFFVVYGFCNWYTAQIAPVPSFYFEWERSVPVIPALIIPYMSIDLFFAASVFLCRDKVELDRHASRIVLAILISAAGFLLFPLHFAFERPPVAGFYGAVFDLLTSFDQPYNQAPSLHISLLIILWVRYAMHARGIWRWLLHAWFFLIGISVVPTFQHHVIDIYTGIAVGVLCFYLIPERAASTDTDDVADPVRRGVGARYLAGGLLALGLGGALLPAGWPFFWVSLALALVAIGYFGVGVRIFQKHEGALSLPARIVLAPYLIGAYLSYRYFTRYRPPWNEIAPGILLGRLPRASDIEDMRNAGVTAILDMTAEFSLPAALRGLHYLNVQVMDLTAPSAMQLAAGADFIARHRVAGKVYVHCALGMSRSAAAVAAALLAVRETPTVEDAVLHIGKVRPGIVLSPLHLETLSATVEQERRA